MKRKKKGIQVFSTKEESLFGGEFVKVAAISVAVIAGIAALMFVSYQGLSRSQFFLVEKIDVTGGKRITAEQVIAWTGLDVQTNLWTIRPGKLEKKLEGKDWVRAAKIERKWPNELLIKIWERTAEAISSQESGLYYLDRSGVLFAELNPGDDFDYPLITGFRGDSDESTRVGLQRALEFIKYAGKGSASLPKQNISEIHIGNEGELVLFMADNPFPISLGHGAVYTKYQQLSKVFSWLYRKDKMHSVASIDMDYLDGRKSSKEFRGRTLVRFTG